MRTNNKFYMTIYDMYKDKGFTDEEINLELYDLIYGDKPIDFSDNDTNICLNSSVCDNKPIDFNKEEVVLC